MGRSTNVPFSILISARLPLLTLRASATAFGMRTARLFPHLQNLTIRTLLFLVMKIKAEERGLIDRAAKIPVVVLARLAVDRAYQGQGLAARWFETPQTAF